MKNEGPTDKQVANIFNSCIAGFAISAAWEMGVLDEMALNGSIDVRSFSQENDLYCPSVAAVVQALACADVVQAAADGESAVPGTLFDEVYETKGFFHWLTRGTAQVFSEWPYLARNEARVGEYIHRDGAAVAVACRDLGYRYFDTPFFQLLEELPFADVADLGCGSAERLIRMAGMRPDLLGVGVDISSGALEVAAGAAEDAGMADRITLVEADARNLSHKQEFDGVDLVTCFLMGHDFWPRSEFVQSFRQLRQAFPDVKNLVLCDTYKSQNVPRDEIPVFTLGFETGHAVMGKYLPTLDEWMGGFEEGGWRCVEHREIPVPAFTSIFVLQPV